MLKKFKRLMATTLVCSLVMSNFTNVYANKQAQVTAIAVTDSSPTQVGATSYKIKYNWTEPLSYEPDGDIDTLHTIPTMPVGKAGYDMYFKNATKNEQATTATKVNTDTLATNMSVNINRDLVDSSIYSFTTQPWHMHTYVSYNADGMPMYTEKRAPYVSGESLIEALYLSDIKLTAESEGTDVTFTWKNPQYYGKNVFAGYNIYYDVGGQNDVKFIQVLNSSQGLTLTNGVYSYTTTLPDITYGQFYDAKIEPIVSSGTGYQEIRSMASPTVTIDQKTYPIGFSSRDYLYQDIYLTPGIELTDISSENIQISWSAGNYSKVEIYKSPKEGIEGSIDGYSLLATLSGTNASITNQILEKPSTITYYKVVFYFNNNTSFMISNWVIYDPTYKQFEPYMPKIYHFEGDESTTPVMLDVIFNAFQRTAVTAEEEELYPNNKLFVDPNVTYKIWITDDDENFYDSSFDDKYVALIDGTAMTPQEYIVPPTSTDSEAGNTVMAYNRQFYNYYAYENGAYVSKPTKDGKIYYIKIVATRPGGDTSKIAYDLTYVKPLLDNTSNPITLTNPPLRLEVDENQVPIRTENSFNIEWQKLWNEVYDYDTEQWYAVIGVNKAGQIVYGKENTTALNDSNRVISLYDGAYFTGDLEGDTARVIEKLKSLGVDQSSENYKNFIMRKANLGTTQYEMYVTTFSNMELNGGYESYLKQFLSEPDSPWRAFSPTADGDNFTYMVNSCDDPSGALEPATSYVVYIRTYIIDPNGNKVYSYNPAYVVGETLSSKETIPVTPPTIILFPVDETQNSITFEFEYASVFEYNLKFSNKLADYTDGGVDITNEELLANGTIYVNAAGDTMIKYTIKNLAPETRYYVWANATYEGNTSAWSLPLEQVTDKMTAPAPPKAIGLMAQSNVDIINSNNGTVYKNPEDNYFIIDFARVPDDETAYTSSITDNGDGSYMFDELIPRFPGAYFDELVPNQKYYVRAKTVLTAVVSDMYAEYYYSYIVQISETPKFEEVLTVHVFDGGFVPDGITTLQVESEWSKSIVVKTGKTTDEYDGDKDDALYPIPDDNFKISSKDDTITFEYRGSGKDSSGVNNNLTDQRLISDLINNGAYSLMADLSSYDTNSKTIREVKLPYRLVNALNTHKIAFTFKAYDTYFTTDFSDIDKIVKANNIKDFGNDSKISIKFADKTNALRGYTGGNSFVGKAIKPSISIETPSRTIEITNTYDTINLAFNVDRTDYSTSNIVIQSFDDFGNSTTEKHKYDDDTATMSIDTKFLKAAGKVRQNVAISSSQSNEYYNVTSALNITDLRTFNGSDPVYALYFNNIVAGIAKDKSSIAMRDTLDSSDYTALGRSGLLIAGDKVKREDAISSLVKLYEIETGTKIQLTTSTSSVPGISKVSSANKQNVAKAYQIGLYDDSNTNFSSTLTFNEFFYMLDLIITDGK